MRFVAVSAGKEEDMENIYRVTGLSNLGRNGLVTAEGIEPTISFSAPAEFKGESGRWTPEHFLVAAVASCFVVTFSAMAEASNLNFLGLDITVEGKLGKVGGRLAFIAIVIRPTLTIAIEDQERGNHLLDKAEQGCLIARSLLCPVTMEAVVRSADEVLTE
jgi:organic hydroperoxide reductase OsmC/OhrA